MELPKISIREERGATLLSMLLKGYRPNWGGKQHRLTKEVDDYFSQNPLDEESVDFLEEIKALDDTGIDEEVLYNMALTLANPERVDDLFSLIAKHKDYVVHARNIREKLTEILKRLETSLPESLKSSVAEATLEDIRKREKSIANIEAGIKKLIEFFRPSSNTRSVRKVTLLPTDHLFREDSGSAFTFDDETILRSHIDNPDGLEHEFLHSIINPIVEKLSAQLSETQKQKISQLANYKLKQDYGEDFFSLLCEEFIRTYNDVLKKDKKPMSYGEFVERINAIADVQFAEMLQGNRSFRSRCEQLEISSLQDLKSKSREYFDRFEYNVLRELVYSLFQKYIQEKERDDKTSFESFVLREFSREI